MVQAITGAHALQKRRVVKSLGTGIEHWSTDFFGLRSTELKAEPQALLTEMSPNETILAHFHAVDQFQVFAAGSGTLGRHKAVPVTVQYVDHHTAYGPITAGPQGLAFFAMRAKTDSGPAYLDRPGYRELLKPTRKRNRVTDAVTLSIEPVLSNRTTVDLERLPFKNEDGADGLGAFMLRMRPDRVAAGPDPRIGGGQYYLVVNGSLERDGESYASPSMIFVDAGEAPLEVRAGPKGLEVLIMQFSREDA